GRVRRVGRIGRWDIAGASAFYRCFHFGAAGRDNRADGVNGQTRRNEETEARGGHAKVGIAVGGETGSAKDWAARQRWMHKNRALDKALEIREHSYGLAARGESLASHRDERGAPPARRDD